MESSSRDHFDSPQPKRLKTLASNVKFSGGNTLLHLLVLDNSHPNDSGSEMYVRAVLLSMSDAPASAVNALNDEGFTALHLAVLKQNLLLVNKLLSCLANIDVNAKGGWGYENTALHLAVWLGHLPIIQELLNKGAGIDIMNRGDETPLRVAMKLRALETVKVLVGADVNRRTSFNTPLHEAALFGSSGIAEFLIDAGADLHARDVYGGTALHDAAARRNLEVAEFLIDRGADVNVRDIEGITPLQYAVQSRNLDIVKLLVGKGADLHPDEDGGTPLHEAVWEENLECVEFFLDQGAPVNAPYVDGATPLHDAAFRGNACITKALVDRGADANARDDYGRTPLDIAKERQSQSCIDALQNVG